MPFSYIEDDLTSERLSLRSPLRVKSADLLEFFVENREFHAPWEPLKDETFYTLESMKLLLKSQWEDHLSRRAASFYLSVRSDKKIIGTVSLSNMVFGPFCSTFVGYRLAREATGNGYMREALSKVLEIGMSVYNLHRFEANIMVNNERSKKVVRSLGFTYEGTSPNYLFIRGRWEDHEHYVFLNGAWKRG
ncbi:MAG: GNAT family N-acetyltransferase [Sphaerochaetaceae bacterium]|nr:GNAT family N-acetyltransferase [Sphaerochaetaceae bacterium]MDC7247925.1 GNAT family N-acetyltransferase [Sphaerochaetaceae bacterium]